jgi:hypothetical protein
LYIFSSSYLFIGDITPFDYDVQDVEGVLEYPTVSGLTEEFVFRLCTDVLVNSTVAKKCGRFFDRDIMHAIDMCVVGKSTLRYFVNNLVFILNRNISIDHNKLFLLSTSLRMFFVQYEQIFTGVDHLK